MNIIYFNYLFQPTAIIYLISILALKYILRMVQNSRSVDLQSLIKKITVQRVNQNIAQIQTQIMSYITTSSKQKIIENLNMLVQKLDDWNFQHVFKYLIDDDDFINENEEELVGFLMDNIVVCGNGLNSMSNKKKILITQLLLNSRINNPDQTFVGYLITSKCHSDLNFCYSLIWNLNQILAQLNLKQLSKFNLNQISVLSMRIVKNYDKLPLHLVDEALRLITQVFVPCGLQSDKPNQQFVKIVYQVRARLILLIRSQTYTLGYAYKFLATYLLHFDKLRPIFQNQYEQQTLSCCLPQIKQIFVNLESDQVNALQNQIERIQQHFKQAQQIKENLDQMREQNATKYQLNSIKQNNFKNKIQLDLRRSLLRGVSYFLCQFFLFFTKQSNQTRDKIMQKLEQNEVLVTFIKVSELLSYCNDKQVFCNFIQLNSKKYELSQRYGINFNTTDQHLRKQIIRNCPIPIFLGDNKKSWKTQQKQSPFPSLKQAQKQLNRVICCLESTIKTQIQEQNRLENMLQMIKDKIQKQYDQAFNKRQFQAAVNTLALIFRVVLKNGGQKIIEEQQASMKHKRTLSKDQITEWIKMLLNLNESCLPAHRKAIKNKTYQLICETFQIILPGNQYLQQVVQTQLITHSYPQKKQFLQQLISFYQKKGGYILKLGYGNKACISKLSPSTLSMNNQSKPLKQQEKATTLNQHSRKSRLLERIFKKMQQQHLSLNHIKYLWEIVFRVVVLKTSQSEKLNEKDLQKMFSYRPQIILARDLAVAELDSDPKQKNKHMPMDKVTQMLENFQIYSYFYADQIRQLNQLIQI